ncbi:MAG: Nif11-like leader peptide family natural product precursor [Nostocaceae cyanobacterium]|nr:Nif11-like leader peptide family natural product precursor [Nostocaceae cyanobacterium]
MSLENVRGFLKHLAQDEALMAQIKAARSKEECSQIAKNAGYDFTSRELEEVAAQWVESEGNDSELRDLNEQELEAVFGGISPIIGAIFILPILLYGMPPLNQDLY